MTPQQQQLDNDLGATPTIVNIKEEVVGLKEGQARIISIIEEEQRQNKEDFKRGADKFKELSKAVDEVRSEVGEMKNQITEGFKKVSEDFTKHIMDSQNSKIDELNTKLDRKSAVKDGIIVTLVGSGLVAVCLWILNNIVK